MAGFAEKEADVALANVSVFQFFFCLWVFGEWNPSGNPNRTCFRCIVCAPVSVSVSVSKRTKDVPERICQRMEDMVT